MNKCICVGAVQNSVAVNNAMIKVEYTWMIMKLRIKIMTVKVAQKMNNLFDMILNNNLLQFLACN